MTEIEKIDASAQEILEAIWLEWINSPDGEYAKP